MLHFDTTVTIETNQKLIKDRLEDLYDKIKKKYRKEGIKLSKKTFFSYMLYMSIEMFDEQQLRDFISESIN